MKNNKYKKGYKIELLREVLDQINNSDSFALIGMPGIGKTDFFQTLQKNKNFWLEYDVKPPKFSFIFIFIDLNNLLGPSPLEFYKYTIHEVAETLITNLENKELIKEIQENLEKAISSNDLFIIFDSLKDILRKVTYGTKDKVCILIDDFAKLKDFNANFFNSLKALRYVNKEKIIFGFSSDQDITRLLDIDKLDELYDTFLNYEITLKPLSVKAANLVFNEWEEQRNYKIPQSARTRIFELSGGHIGYMKALNKTYQELGKTTKIFDLKNIEKLEELPAINSRSEKFWKKLSKSNKEIIQQIIVDPSREIENFPRFLTQTGIIKRVPNNKLKVFSPLLEQHIKRLVQEGQPNKVYHHGLFIDRKSKEVFFNGTQIMEELTISEYKILSFFMRHPRELISREVIAKVLWGNKSIEKYSDWAIDRAISRLRKKIGDNKSTSLIKTLRGRGFKFENKK